MTGTRIERVRTRRDLEVVLSWLGRGGLGGEGLSPFRPERLLADPKVLLALAWGREPKGFSRLDLGPGVAEFTLYVVPAHRRKGVGRLLLQWALGEAKGRKLYSMVEEGNERAHAFFRAQGFRSFLSGARGWIRWEVLP
ncbi:MAG TPA: GNAT family N-acetyltransferase [Planctomycetes bacterium]|nr:GNAT family N-acetyltransferase [Planctomycetota bacterium]